jgi:hypothetical protein
MDNRIRQRRWRQGANVALLFFGLGLASRLLIESRPVADVVVIVLAGVMTVYIAWLLWTTLIRRDHHDEESP